MEEDPGKGERKMRQHDMNALQHHDAWGGVSRWERRELVVVLVAAAARTVAAAHAAAVRCFAAKTLHPSQPSNPHPQADAATTTMATALLLPHLGRPPSPTGDCARRCCWRSSSPSASR